MRCKQLEERTAIAEWIDYYLISPYGETVRLIASFPGSKQAIRVKMFYSVAEGLAYMALAGLQFAKDHRELKF